MSRICVKNLPKHVAEDQLRQFFSKKGEVTDAKLMRTKDGKSRQFGFVGFRTELEAEEAIKYFNKSYMNTSRIICEIAQKVGDPNIPRPWSRHSLNKQDNISEEKRISAPKSSKATISKDKCTKSTEDNLNDDPLFQEFLEVTQHRSRSKLWANDAVVAPSVEQNKVVYNNTFKLVKRHEEELGREDAHLKGMRGERTISLEEQEQEADELNVSDMDYFKSRTRTDWSDSESTEDGDSADDTDHDDVGGDDDDSSNSQNMINPGPVGDALEPDISGGEAEDVSSRDSEIINSVGPSSSPGNKNEEVLESGRLFIRNLPYTSTEEELENHFSKYGSISQVHIVVDKDTKRSKGIAYILFALPESAVRALEEMDGSIFQGRPLHVMPAEQKNHSSKQKIHESGTNSSISFKQQRNAEKKASEASGNTRAWNSLFMRSDTVVENIARKFGVSKSALLDRESDDLAVRIALGETRVIAETKKALASAGVNIASLEEFAAGKTDVLKRSNHVILVKNLHYSSSESELSDMFGKFGSLDKIILPPTKTLALVIFLEPSEARAALKGLAYRRYKDSPLYLEWAPQNILSQAPIAGDNTVGGEIDVKRALLEQEITDADVNPDRIESRSLYVKNLNFKTSDAAVKKHFTERMKGGKLLSVRVKKHLKNGKTVSKGFCFIEFDSLDTAVNVCRDLQGTVLDGHALILELCHAKKDKQLPKKIEKDGSSTKLSVKNVAFEATKKDLRQLFSPFGQIKSLRLPMKFGDHKGYAFVEYVTKREARNALQALANTHLYGRRLVLEIAKEGESLDELRAKTSAQFTDSSKLSRKRKHMTVLDEGNVKFQRIAD